MDDLVGRKLDKYELQAKLGEGGMGAVYRSWHPQLNRPVAIKILPASLSHDSSFHARFQREGQAMAALNHPNIIRVYDVDEYDGLYYMVMDFVEGGSLEQRLKSGTPMGLYWACDVIARVAESLNYAHRKGVVHRDIKPANILLTGEDDPVVADFGIARLVTASEGGENLTQVGTVVGTPAYMAPEQILGGELDGRSDLYSLGIVLYQLLTGRLPFTGDTMAVVTAQINAAPPPLRMITPDLPPPLEQVVLMALAKRPQDRFGSGAAFAAAIRNALQSVGPAGFVRAAPAAVAVSSFATVRAEQAAALPQLTRSLSQQQTTQTAVKLAIGAVVAAVLLLIVLELIAALFYPLLVVALVIGAFYIYRGYDAAQKAKRGQTVAGVQPGPALPAPQWGSPVQQGLGLYRNGQFPEALAAFNQALSEEPNNIDALISRGLAYYTLGDLPQAENDFQAALAINPRHPRALYQRALVHQALGRVPEAIAELEQVLGIIPAQAALRREAEARLRSLDPARAPALAQEAGPTRDLPAPSATNKLQQDQLIDQTVVYPSGAPQGGDADQTVVYPSGAPQGGDADQTVVYPSGAPQGGDADQTVVDLPASTLQDEAQRSPARKAPKTGPLGDLPDA